jgi:hypothetical protein
MPPDADQLILGVYRDLENRRCGEPDDGPLARAAHQRRRQALESDLAEPCYMVVSWGDTKDTRPHELVEVVVGFLSSPAVHAAVVPAAAFIGGIFANTFTSLLVDGVKALFVKLVERVRQKDCQDFYIKMSDGSTINVRSDCNVEVHLQDGRYISFSYNNPPAAMTSDSKC